MVPQRRYKYQMANKWVFKNRKDVRRKKKLLNEYDEKAENLNCLLDCVTKTAIAFL